MPKEVLNSAVIKCLFFLQRCRITIFSISVSEKEKLPGISESSIFFEIVGFFLRKKILLSPEQSHGMACYAVFKVSTIKIMVLINREKKTQKRMIPNCSYLLDSFSVLL